MNCNVKVAEFRAALQAIQGAIERKTTIPVLAHVLLEADQESLRLTATDLELAITLPCAAKVVEPGKATAPGRRLLEIVKALPDAELQMKAAENDRLALRCGPSHLKLVGISAGSFPALPSMPAASTELPAKPLAAMLRKTAFSISAEESRYVLQGALLRLTAEGLTIVATDGHRLAHTQARTVTAKDELRVLVPSRAAHQLIAWLDEPAEGATVSFARDDSHLFFRYSDRLLVARLLAGQFPNYEAVLPKEATRKAIVDRDLLAAALHRARLVADPRSNAIIFGLTSEGLEVKASSSEYGEAREGITTPKPPTGAPLQVGFNANYLIDFLEAAAPGPVSCEFKDAESAADFRALAEEDIEYRYVVMPMRV